MGIHPGERIDVSGLPNCCSGNIGIGNELCRLSRCICVGKLNRYTGIGRIIAVDVQ